MRKIFVFLALVITISTHAWAFRPLEEGDEIRLIAPSRGVTKAHLDATISMIEAAGFKATVGKNAFDFETSLPWANTHEMRGADFVEAYQSGARMLWAICGGFGAADVIDYMERINFDPGSIVTSPIIAGFSDITNFHLWCTKHNIPSLHSVNIGQLADLDKFSKVNSDEDFTSICRALKDPTYKPSYTLNWLNPDPNATDLQSTVVGGCFSIIQRNLATPTQLNAKGAILFFEDTDGDSFPRVHSLFMQLKRAGYFSNSAALIIGNIEFYGIDRTTALKTFIKDCKILIPVFDAPFFGHGKENKLLPLKTAAKVKFDHQAGSAELEVNLFR